MDERSQRTPMDTVASPDCAEPGTSVAETESDAGTRLSHDDRRASILRAVRETCAEDGISRLSVAAITKRAGCTRSLFYHYFADKEAAVEAVMDEAIDGFISELKAWNASRTEGDVEGALDSIAPLFKRLVLDSHDLPGSLNSGSGAFYGGFLNSAVARVVDYICSSTVQDFDRMHGLPIEHVYETFYTLIMGLLMYIRTHPDVPEDTIKDIIAASLHIDTYTAKGRLDPLGVVRKR